MENGGILPNELRTERDSMANEEDFAGHLLATRSLAFDYGADRLAVGRITEVLANIMAGTTPDDLNTDVQRLYDFEDCFAGLFGMERPQVMELVANVLKDLERALRTTDWRLGYGKTRDDATVPEAAAEMVVLALRLLGSAFSNDGIRAFRNRHSEFIEGMAQFAEEANGAPHGNADFYSALGRQVARYVLDHKLDGDPRPKLAPSGQCYEVIEVAALTQLVYFIQSGEEGPIKIGIARDPESRLAALQTGHHEELRLLAITHGGADQEGAYHMQFAEHRIRGEWFEPHPDILAEIDRLNAGK